MSAITVWQWELRLPEMVGFMASATVANRMKERVYAIIVVPIIMVVINGWCFCPLVPCSCCWRIFKQMFIIKAMFVHFQSFQQQQHFLIENRIPKLSHSQKKNKKSSMPHLPNFHRSVHAEISQRWIMCACIMCPRSRVSAYEIPFNIEIHSRWPTLQKSHNLPIYLIKRSPKMRMREYFGCVFIRFQPAGQSVFVASYAHEWEIEWYI